MCVHVRHAAAFRCSVLYRRLRHVAEELTTDEQAIWAAQARVSDSTAMETLLMPLPTAVAVQIGRASCRERVEATGQRLCEQRNVRAPLAEQLAQTQPAPHRDS